MMIILDIGRSGVEKVLKKLVNLIPDVDFSNEELEGPGKVVQVNETILKYKFKSHRG